MNRVGTVFYIPALFFHYQISIVSYYQPIPIIPTYNFIPVKLGIYLKE